MAEFVLLNSEFWFLKKLVTCMQVDYQSNASTSLLQSKSGAFTVTFDSKGDGVAPVPLNGQTNGNKENTIKGEDVAAL